jgi:hypothetical protein
MIAKTEIAEWVDEVDRVRDKAVREIAYDRTGKTGCVVCPVCATPTSCTLACDACFAAGIGHVVYDFDEIVRSRDNFYAFGVALRATDRLPPLAPQTKSLPPTALGGVPFPSSKPKAAHPGWAALMGLPAGATEADLSRAIGAMGATAAVASVRKSPAPHIATPRSPHTPTLGPWSPEEPELLIIGTSQEGLARLLFLASPTVQAEIEKVSEPGADAARVQRIRDRAWGPTDAKSSTMPGEREKAEALAAAVFDVAKVAT